MLSLTAVSNHSVVSPHPLPYLNFHTSPSVVFLFNPRRQHQHSVCLNLKEGGSLGFSKRGGQRSRWCKCFEREGDSVLEAQILEFMQKSKRPDVFPSKKELVDGGRMDLVDAIVKRGGWLSLGWDSDDDMEEKVLDEEVKHLGSITEIASDNGGLVGGHREDFDSASSSGRSLGTATATEDETGIEGILSRLEKQRNMSFGVGLEDKENGTRVSSNDGGDGLPHPGTSTDLVAGLEKSSRPTSLNPKSFSDFDGLRNSVNPRTWRTWSIQRAGFSDREFEAAEISFYGSRMGGATDASKDEILEITEGATKPLDRRKELNSYGKEINHDQIRTRLQDLELELASALRLLRSKSDESISQKDDESSFNDLQKLSDAWEFQENEIMNAHDRLRSIRAKLTVLEGKMALAIIDAQKIVEEKQNRIDDARSALRLLRTACIVWPSSASKVLLAGSFDGWATQRKMERSSTGIFSLCLKLYPGRYEIKFIVDGIWRIDPLRPVVNGNGYENNLLLIT